MYGSWDDHDSAQLWLVASGIGSLDELEEYHRIAGLRPLPDPDRWDAKTRRVDARPRMLPAPTFLSYTMLHTCDVSCTTRSSGPMVGVYAWRTQMRPDGDNSFAVNSIYSSQEQHLVEAVGTVSPNGS